MKINSILAFTSALALAGAAQAGPTQDAPAIVHSTCAMCHTEHGNEPALEFVPRLAAQNATYIEEQLGAFKDGSRADPPAVLYMWPMTQTLSDADMKAAAEWFASQPPPAPSAKDSTWELGRDIFQKGVLGSDVPACSSCHGDKAEGNGIFPRLAGQNAQYLLGQLLYFRSNSRNDKGADIMKPIAQHLNDDQMDAVAKYLSTL